ncbi:MAG TPA: hypothetical protein VKU38_03135 [Ktedonobacteraceae bacterium]|nr:hypothetical protein [Ktedonobacteraceae bacterium]
MSSARFPVQWMKRHYLAYLFSMVAILALIVSACSSSPGTTSTSSDTSSGTQNQGPGALGLAALPGYTVTLFARRPATSTAPDAVVVDGNHVFIDYQNVTAKDCTDTNTSTIIEYNMNGSQVKTFSVAGHSDGMRVDPSTGLLWISSCEDGNAKFFTIDTTSGTITPYTFSAAPHGGGYDDMYFVNGTAFIAASNPNVNSAGVNVFPAIDKITLSNGKAVLTPILMGNATATDLTTNKQVTLNEIDPDSMTVDAKGQLVLVNQAGNELVFLKNPGTPQQQVSRVPVGDSLDDTVWATSTSGRLLVVDASGNTVWISAPQFTPGTVYTEAPSDSGTAGFVGVVDLSTGIVTPVVIGFGSPSGMLFVPNS